MPYTNEEKQQLLAIARQSIDHGLKTGKALDVDPGVLPESLRAKRATFLTLQKQGHLRGCIGTLEAEKALATDVALRAYSAAFHDPRFLPVQTDEADELEISISILSPSTPMEFISENDLLAQIQPGIDGLVLEDGFNKGVFLPSVWEQLPDKKAFLAHLKNKAGLHASYWSDNLKVARFKTEYIS